METQAWDLVLIGLLQAICLGLVSWGLLQTVNNGKELASMVAEFRVRMAKGDKEHEEFVRRNELDPLMKELAKLSLSIDHLADKFEAEREARIIGDNK